MRNYKAISFEEFASNCDYRSKNYARYYTQVKRREIRVYDCYEQSQTVCSTCCKFWRLLNPDKTVIKKNKKN